MWVPGDARDFGSTAQATARYRHSALAAGQSPPNKVLRRADPIRETEYYSKKAITGQTLESTRLPQRAAVDAAADCG
jgi:hypothetical protein